ncbi:Glucans biosynthesis protein C [uncultured Clostridium sp.]|uniref:acyltransferase family protein n=1 Tax=uncultured Clostridium sp. TaxID=59620 RepID=UPI000821DB41|nr:acyltransferase family protein [uncultured Clostridium sp.]SCJ62159.1 Glucans biosynthesis protein C [uncultured Clostridium sp.]
MRRNEIDWIRNICILMLFVYHTAVLFTDFGDFYIKAESSNLFSNIFILLTFSWYMPLLFFLAGASTYFALQKRNGGQYIKERVKRLLIPFIFGIIVIVPPQTYLARLWRGETNINYFSHLKMFFTNVSDFMGFDGNFSPAHLWFIIFLFAISIVGVLIIKWMKTKPGKAISNKVKPIVLGKQALLWVLASLIILEMIPTIGGKGVLTNLLLFILGYAAYSDNEVIERLSNNRRRFLKLTITTILLGATYFFFFRGNQSETIVYTLDGILKSTISLIMGITIVSYGIRYLNKKNKVLDYLNKASFPVYILHQTILLVLAFYILPLTLPAWISIVLIICLSFGLTFMAYEICKRIKFMNVLLGIK